MENKKGLQNIYNAKRQPLIVAKSNIKKLELDLNEVKKKLEKGLNMKKTNWSKFFKGLGGFVTGDFVSGVNSTMKKTFAEAEKKIEKATSRAIKASAVYLMMFIGFIFLLVGFAHYLAGSYPLKPGMGYVIVGAIIVFLGYFAKAMR